jgi:hypothetical protein
VRYFFQTAVTFLNSNGGVRKKIAYAPSYDVLRVDAFKKAGKSTHRRRNGEEPETAIWVKGARGPFVDETAPCR